MFRSFGDEIASLIASQDAGSSLLFANARGEGEPGERVAGAHLDIQESTIAPVSDQGLGYGAEPDIVMRRSDGTVVAIVSKSAPNVVAMGVDIDPTKVFNLGAVLQYLDSRDVELFALTAGVPIDNVPSLSPHEPISATRLFFDAEVVFNRAEEIARIDPIQTFQTVVNDPGQRELPLAASFVPSRQLLDLWIRSLNSHLKEAKSLGSDESIELFSIVNDRRRLEKEFYNRLRGIIVRQAHMYSYSRKVYRLSINHAFSATFMARVADEFMIRIDFGTKFFDLLFQEIRAWLGKGRSMSGTWGRLDVDKSGDLVFFLKKAKVAKVPGFSALGPD